MDWEAAAAIRVGTQPIEAEMPLDGSIAGALSDKANTVTEEKALMHRAVERYLESTYPTPEEAEANKQHKRWDDMEPEDLDRMLAMRQQRTQQHALLQAQLRQAKAPRHWVTAGMGDATSNPAAAGGLEPFLESLMRAPATASPYLFSQSPAHGDPYNSQPKKSTSLPSSRAPGRAAASAATKARGPRVQPKRHYTQRPRSAMSPSRHRQREEFNLQVNDEMEEAIRRRHEAARVEALRAIHDQETKLMSKGLIGANGASTGTISSGSVKRALQDAAAHHPSLLSALLEIASKTPLDLTQYTKKVTSETQTERPTPAQLYRGVDLAMHSSTARRVDTSGKQSGSGHATSSVHPSRPASAPMKRRSRPTSRPPSASSMPGGGHGRGHGMPSKNSTSVGLGSRPVNGLKRPASAHAAPTKRGAVHSGTTSVNGTASVSGLDSRGSASADIINDDEDVEEVDQMIVPMKTKKNALESRGSGRLSRPSSAPPISRSPLATSNKHTSGQSTKARAQSSSLGVSRGAGDVSGHATPTAGQLKHLNALLMGNTMALHIAADVEQNTQFKATHNVFNEKLQPVPTRTLIGQQVALRSMAKRDDPRHSYVADDERIRSSPPPSTNVRVNGSLDDSDHRNVPRSLNGSPNGSPRGNMAWKPSGKVSNDDNWVVREPVSSSSPSASHGMTVNADSGERGHGAKAKTTKVAKARARSPTMDKRLQSVLHPPMSPEEHSSRISPLRPRAKPHRVGPGAATADASVNRGKSDDHRLLKEWRTAHGPDLWSLKPQVNSKLRNTTHSTFGSSARAPRCIGDPEPAVLDNRDVYRALRQARDEELREARARRREAKRQAKQLRIAEKKRLQEELEAMADTQNDPTSPNGRTGMMKQPSFSRPGHGRSVSPNSSPKSRKEAEGVSGKGPLLHMDSFSEIGIRVTTFGKQVLSRQNSQPTFSWGSADRGLNPIPKTSNDRVPAPKPKARLIRSSVVGSQTKTKLPKHAQRSLLSESSNGRIARSKKPVGGKKGAPPKYSSYYGVDKSVKSQAVLHPMAKYNLKSRSRSPDHGVVVPHVRVRTVLLESAGGLSGNNIGSPPAQVIEEEESTVNLGTPNHHSTSHDVRDSEHDSESEVRRLDMDDLQ